MKRNHTILRTINKFIYANAINFEIGTRLENITFETFLSSRNFSQKTFIILNNSSPSTKFLFFCIETAVLRDNVMEAR